MSTAAATTVPQSPAVRRRLFVQGLLTRSFLALVFAAVFVAFAASGERNRSTMLAGATILATLALANVPYWWIGARRGFPTSDFIAHWAIDIVLLTVMIHFIGGINAPYCGLAYSSLVLFSAVTESRKVAMRLAVLSLVCFGVLVAVEASGLVASRSEIWDHRYGPAAQIFSFVAPFVFVFELAWVGGTLSDQLKAANSNLTRFSARIEEQNRTLEYRVAERTAELARAQEEIEDLVHIVTHDLKNVSVAATETARKLVTRESAGLSPRGLKYAEHLLDDARNMSRMLENLLSLFRDAEPEEKQREWVDVDGIVRKVFSRLHSEIDTKQVQIDIGTLPTFYGETAKIRHVFDNLIDNACKYVGDSHPPRIAVWGERREGRVTYYVRDNGIGIDPRHINRIFQLYHRSPNQTVNGVDQAGHGVGLAIVKRIVERHGGTIAVESTPHHGSTFAVSFPVEPAEAHA
ncbi:MAG TPA: HAMP domain-containing sensor histidine kinase [Candidatus Binatia bacterium]|nr:HAMP domain-containing sensor histidine kinase [Candidatus Binatia bacterium]